MSDQQRNKIFNMNTPDDVSLITILQPRESDYESSSTLNTEFLIELDTIISCSERKNRKNFVFQTLSFCLGLPNLWRFAKEAFTQDHAAFVWLYIIFMLTIGGCLLFFEVVLSHYSANGFTKVFSVCPLFEGISYAMAFYCVTVSTYYNVLNSYSFIYLFASFNETLEYATCSPFPRNICIEGTFNQSLSPEYAYFYHRSIYYTINGVYNESIYNPNWINVGILFILWVLLCIVIFKGIARAKWSVMVYCPAVYVVLIVTLILALTTLKGSAMGLKAMFDLQFKSLLNFDVWRRAFQQTIVALGLGMGPLITLGSYTKFQSPVDVDCMIICICVLICSLLSGSIVFVSAGVLAYERNKTIENILKHHQYYTDLSVHIVFSQLFSRFPPVLSHVVSFAFFFTLLYGGWHSLITYIETFVASLHALFPASLKHKIYTNLGSCTLCLTLGALLLNGTGYSMLISIDRYLVEFGLMIIVLCELIAIIYIYGLGQFSEDTEYHFGFNPNMYIQTIWILSPLLLMIMLSELILFRLREEVLTFYDVIMLCVVAIVIVLPIIGTGLYKLHIGCKMGNMKSVLEPHNFLSSEDNVILPNYNYGRDCNKEGKALQARNVEVAGPSKL